jgi:predicted small lipoprotein YifL
MKKSFLLATLVAALATLAGCGHPTELVDDIAALDAPSVQA